MTAGIDPRTPVIIGIGVAQQNTQHDGTDFEAIALMELALRRAAADTGAADESGLLSTVEMVSVPKGMWTYTNPGALLATRIGAPAARSALFEIGVLQTSLFCHAVESIRNGDVELMVIAGGEAKHRALRATIAGHAATESLCEPGNPDVHVMPASDIIHEIEIQRGLPVPARQYAMIDSALRYAQGKSIAQHTQLLAELWSSFSSVAVDNVDAWNREFASPATMMGTAANPMLAFPYTKLHCSQWNVDQSAAFIMCSLQRAQQLGIDEARLVFPHAIAESNFMAPLVERRQMHRSPAIAHVGAALATSLNRRLDDVDYLDLYSCFPAAVRMQIEEFGITPSAHAALTITGGMTFGGGPLNNYSLQSIAKMGALVRAEPNAIGITTSVSGMLTKFGAAAWSNTAPDSAVALMDVTESVGVATQLLPVDSDFVGFGTIASYTVEHDKGVAQRAIAIIDTPSRARTVATSSDATIIASCMRNEWIGHQVEVDRATFSVASTAAR